MLICCLKLNSVLWQSTSDHSVFPSSTTCSATVAAFFFLRTSFLLKADQKLFIRLCVLRHHCRFHLHLCVLACMFFLRLPTHTHTHTCFCLPPLALIICGARPWAEVSGDPPTLIQCVCVCLSLCIVPPCAAVLLHC